jgi:hypothetical protein
MGFSAGADVEQLLKEWRAVKKEPPAVRLSWLNRWGIIAHGSKRLRDMVEDIQRKHDLMMRIVASACWAQSWMSDGQACRCWIGSGSSCRRPSERFIRR